MMNVSGILMRVFEKSRKEHVISLIKEKRPNWFPSKDMKTKSDFKDIFMDLQGLIKEDEIEDFIELAVMTKMVGLPAYTYQAENMDFLLEESQAYVDLDNIVDIEFQSKYIVSIEEYSGNNDSLRLEIRLKEYLEEWRRGNRDPLSLSAVYKVRCILNKENGVFTIYSGNHQVQEVIKDFIDLILKCPLKSYRIKDHSNQSWQIGNASFKTAQLLDFILNRLKKRGISPKFEEIKFNTRNKKHQKDGIRNIIINGHNLLSSQLACEYVSLGCDIISFKVNISYQGEDLSAAFYLKGSTHDILKVVILNNDNIEAKNKIVNIIQSEYIEMCREGISDITETQVLINSIYDRFTKYSDRLVNQVILDSTLKSIKSFLSVSGNLDLNDETINESIKEFCQQNKAILDSIGYDEVDNNLVRIRELIGLEEDDIDLQDEDKLDDINETEEQIISSN